MDNIINTLELTIKKTAQYLYSGFTNNGIYSGSYTFTEKCNFVAVIFDTCFYSTNAGTQFSLSGGGTVLTNTEHANPSYGGNYPLSIREITGSAEVGDVLSARVTGGNNETRGGFIVFKIA